MHQTLTLCMYMYMYVTIELSYYIDAEAIHAVKATCIRTLGSSHNSGWDVVVHMYGNMSVTRLLLQGSRITAQVM